MQRNITLPRYIMMLFLITLVLRIVLIPYYDNNLGGIEPNVIYGIQRILAGQPLYQHPAAGSYAILQYTPLNYIFTAAVARLVSIDVPDVHGLYVVARTVALLFNLLTVLMCVCIVRTWRFGWLHSFVFSVPLFICLTAHYYTRGDSMHLFLFAVAMYAFIFFTKHGGLPSMVISALATALCILTRQSGVLCAAIILFCLLFLQRRYLMAALYAAATVTFAWFIASLCVSGNWISFYQNSVLGLKNGVDLSFLCTIFISPYFLDIVPCYIVGGVMVFLAAKKIADTTFRTLAAGMALSWLFAAITGLKVGSSNNYFTEFLFFVFTALPYFLQHDQGKTVLLKLRTFHLTISKLTVIALCIIVTSKTMGLVTAVYIEKSYKNNKAEYASEQALLSYFKNVLHIQPGQRIFFTERRFLDNIFFEHAIMPTKDVVTQVYTTDSTTFSYAAFTAGMNNGLISYIVTDNKRDDINICSDSLPFILFDKKRFLLLARVYGYSIYRYEPGPLLPQDQIP